MANDPCYVNACDIPGHYTEILTIVDDNGSEATDFVVVQVFDQANPIPVPPAIHVAYWPTMDIKAGDQVTFKVRTFEVEPEEGEEVWDFGDGTLAAQHSPMATSISMPKMAMRQLVTGLKIPGVIL